ncbi:MAG: hypothetical protein J6A94_13045 [Lachnospiraceae bacterium]|nr:hypothetical protein [Lachnospiraceae bacterium]
MQVNTNISNVLEGNADKSKYDSEVKKILSDKTILSWIMKYSIREFEQYSIEMIRECIEGEPEISTRKVLPGYSPEEISGMNTESSVPGEGTITYDICFYAMIPGGEQVKLIINVEAQKSFYPGYDIVTRAVFYCARLLSAQCGTEFTPRNYNDIKKVYSIWICMDVPQKMEYKITKYKMNKEEVYGQVSDEGRYDLLEVVMICLGREEKLTAGTMLHGLLSTLLSDELEPNEKKQILKQEYGIATSVEMEGGLQKMCNLSEMIEEKAIKRGMAKGIEKGIEKGTYMTLVSLVKDNILSEADAAARCGLSVEEFHKILESTHTS